MLDSVNNFFDTATGIVSVIAFVRVGAQLTEKYPFGLGRSEYLAGFIVALASLVMGVLFLKDSLERMIMPEPVWFGVQSCILISCTAVVKLIMALWFGIANKKIKSKTLSAICMDCFLDTGITVASVISFAVSSLVGYAVDAIFGIIISCIVIIIAVFMTKDNLKSLVAGSSYDEEKDKAKEICLEKKTVTKVLRIDVHDYGYGRAKGTVVIETVAGIKFEEFKSLIGELQTKLKNETNIDFNVTLP